MADSFNNIRRALFAIAFVGAAVTLGITVNLIGPLLPTGLHDFLIFSVVVSALTIIVILLLVQRSQPKVDTAILFILAALWLTMGAYSTDVVGHQFCYSLKGQTMPAKNGTTYSAESYCRQIKTVQAFSWANFVFLTIGFIKLITMLDNDNGDDRSSRIGSMSNASLTGAPVTLPPQTYPQAYPQYPQAYPDSPIMRSHSGRSHSGRSQGGRSQSGRSQSGRSHSGREGGRQTYVYVPGNVDTPPQRRFVQQQPGHSVVVQNGQVHQVPGSVVSV